MSKIAFLGLGQMGTPMASRLIEAGHDLTVWNRTREKTEPLVALGAAVASSPAEAVGGVEVAITMVSNPQALMQVLFGPDGVASGLREGQVLVDMSTVGPDVVGGIRGRIPSGVNVVDAPVRGSVPEATEGTLMILVGATDEAFEQVRDILPTLGKVWRIGGPGAGAAMKLVVNSTLGAAIGALGEALSLGDALGLARTTILDVLSNSPIGDTVRLKRGNIESGSYPSEFKLSLALKDLRLVEEAASGAGHTLRLAPAARAWLEEAEDSGAGDLDYSAVVATIMGDGGSGRSHAGL
jgi:3-hydroxyisobutyrate dehydrogenase-like beta-hydroxyacid dehydrogenase